MDVSTYFVLGTEDTGSNNTDAGADKC